MSFQRLALALVLLLLAATIAAAKSNFAWNGNMQNRFIQEKTGICSFSIRRTKLWVAGSAPGHSEWHYKVKSIFHPLNKGAFDLQDVFAEYRFRLWTLRMAK